MKETFIELLGELGITVTENQYQQFQKYYEILIEWNDKINLTAITDIEDVFMKHFYDSVCLVKAIDINHQTLLDVGSGAGFPSIPLKILFPELKVTIIDALNKRIKFLEILVKELDVEAELIHGRAEDYKRKHCFDIVTARAVANMQMLTELCLPFAKVNGVFAAMKGPRLVEELPGSLNAITVLGGKVKETIEYDIDDQKRSIVVIDKIQKSSPKYPRKFNQIKSNPL